MSISDSAAINQISRFAYQAILNIQQQQPELLNEKYRKVQWSNIRNQSVFLDKLNEELSNVQDWDARLLKVRRFLQVFLFPNSLETPVVSDLHQKIRAYVQQQIESQLNSSSGSDTSESDPSASQVAPRSEGIAILLLDAENLQLNAETEKFLGGICTYPIQIKIAFANWRTMGKQDAELHTRGYELIHVPPGKDSADVKMATVGSSIFIHYPTAREVLVCSSDGVMTHLCTTLQTHGLTVYLVRRQGDMITVFNSQTGQTQTHSLIPVPEIPSLEQFITQLKDLIRAEQARTGKFWIKLARLSSLFQFTYKLTISEIVSVHFPEKRAREIFSNFPEDFAVHQLPGHSELYVTLFEINPPNTATQPNTGTSKESQAKALRLMKVESKAELEQVLFRILRALTAKSPGSYIPISNLATEFQKQYSVSITNAIRHLQLGNKLPQVLQSFQVFKLKKVERMYYVSVRAEAIAASKPEEALPDYSSVSDRKLVGTPETSAEQPSVAQPEKQGGA
ncbi:MAG: NYN domain-containing protein [Coleofasciculus sp. S288]|nr:NYN domain-containing protein [Coleofasciculus sp. S288]